MNNDKDIAERCLMMYIQEWGQSVQERIDALNNAAKAAGLKCEFQQGPNGEKAGWYGDEPDRGVEFRRRIDACWTGKFETEVLAIMNIIQSTREESNRG